MPQICTKMNGFKFDFSKIFWGGAHRAPSPDPSPRFFSGFALNSRALRALDSGFALDTRALRALDSGSPSTFDWGPWFGPPKINSWIRPWSPDRQFSNLPAWCVSVHACGLRLVDRLFPVHLEQLSPSAFTKRSLLSSTWICWEWEQFWICPSDTLPPEFDAQLCVHNHVVSLQQSELDQFTYASL